MKFTQNKQHHEPHNNKQPEENNSSSDSTEKPKDENLSPYLLEATKGNKLIGDIQKACMVTAGSAAQ